MADTLDRISHLKKSYSKSCVYQVVEVANRDVAENEHETGEDDLQVDVFRVLKNSQQCLPFNPTRVGSAFRMGLLGTAQAIGCDECNKWRVHVKSLPEADRALRTSA